MSLPPTATRARRGLVEPGEDAQRGGLAAARRAQQGHQLTGLDVQGQPVEGLHRAVDAGQVGRSTATPAVHRRSCGGSGSSTSASRRPTGQQRQHQQQHEAEQQHGQRGRHRRRAVALADRARSHRQGVEAGSEAMVYSPSTRATEMNAADRIPTRCWAPPRARSSSSTRRPATAPPPRASAGRSPTAPRRSRGRRTAAPARRRRTSASAPTRRAGTSPTGRRCCRPTTITSAGIVSGSRHRNSTSPLAHGTRSRTQIIVGTSSTSISTTVNTASSSDDHDRLSASSATRFFQAARCARRRCRLRVVKSAIA